jgi:RNA polymerase sigma-70 factor (ECF subfamily)
MTPPIPTTDPDRPLVARARVGDEAAFQELVRRHERRLFQVCFRVCGNAADPEDVLQETFLILFRKLGTFRGAARFSTCSYRIAANVALMRRRVWRRQPTESLDRYLPAFRRDGRHKRVDVGYSAAARIEGSIQKEQLLRIVLGALQRLPPAIRRAIVLCELEELSAPDAAKMLGLKAATIRQRVHRGRLLLRGYLDAIARGATEASL